MPSQTEIAEHLGITQPTVSRLQRSGVIARGATMDVTRLAYLDHLREIAAGRSSDRDAPGGLDLVRERARLASEQANRVAMQNDLQRGMVVLVSDVAEMVGAEYAVVRTKLLAIPSEQAPRLHHLKTPAAIQDALGAVIVEALESLTQDGPAGAK